MAPPIQRLPTEVVHLIAAGEVIDSLAAVVRELAENALDAQATRIHIALWPEQWRVRVSDNGQGMALRDLQQAALPHCTSKIHHRRDLWQIYSLGFRGEALHSLAQLADLEICSRGADADAAYRITYDHQGQPLSVQPLALAPGTIVTATHLFATWQARRHSLPAPAQQLRAVQLVVQQLALCHPQVIWQVEQNDRSWFALGAGAGSKPGSNTGSSAGSITSAKPLLTQILRLQPSDLHELTHPLPSGETLYLVIGLPDRCHRRRPDWIKIAVNGRIVQFATLEQSVLAAFRRTLPRDRYPVCLVHLQVSPADVDWNRHPAKAEIYLRHLESWQTQVQQGIEQALQSSLAEPPDAAFAPQLGALLKVTEAEGVYRTSRALQPLGSKTEEVDSQASDQAEQALPDSAPSASMPQPLISLKAVAQVHQMYILAEHPTGMWLIEQHIAHERVLYEQLCERWQIVPLELPLVLGTLSPAQLEQLQRLGMTVDAFGEQRWAARSAPDALAQRSDCAEALLELSQGGDLEFALVATACRTAIRNGTILSLPEMQYLLNQWQQTRRPRTCPHGRPIYFPLEESSLSRFFRRHWVIGKSHGI